MWALRTISKATFIQGAEETPVIRLYLTDNDPAEKDKKFVDENGNLEFYLEIPEELLAKKLHIIYTPYPQIK